MLLSSFTILMGLGFIIWLTGHYFRYKGVAAIGAAFFIIAGSAVALTGLEYRTGETRVDVDNNTTEVTYDYQDVEILEVAGTGAASDLGMGGLVLVLGGVLFSQTLSEGL